MNARADGFEAPAKEEITASLQNWLDNGEIEEFGVAQNGSYAQYSGYLDDYLWIERTVYFQEDETAPIIKKRVVADPEVTNYLNLDKVAEFIYQYIDANALMVMDRIAFLWDTYDEFDCLQDNSEARGELASLYNDEYAYEIGEGNLGITWVEHGAVIVNVANILKSAKEIAAEPDEWHSEETLFREALIQTICHECRHLLYECNEIIEIGEGTSYPEDGGMEYAVEEYGNDEADRLLHDKSARRLINAMFRESEKALEIAD